ncbi:unnamed protein product [Ectocarpus sp. 12 AP-2014]
MSGLTTPHERYILRDNQPCYHRDPAAAQHLQLSRSTRERRRAPTHLLFQSGLSVPEPSSPLPSPVGSRDGLQALSRRQLANMLMKHEHHYATNITQTCSRLGGGYCLQGRW